MTEFTKLEKALLGIIAAGTIASISFVFGVEFGRRQKTPNTVYQTDINEDGLQDIIVQSNMGQRYLFIKEPGAGYRPFASYAEDARAAFEKSSGEERAQLEERLSKIKFKANVYK